MEILGSGIKDARINSTNYMIELTMREYYELSRNILDNNDYQRRRVKSSTSVYSLLREDLKRGCLMPPIVLALKADADVRNIETIIKEHKDDLVILDGLQRSYTIQDVVNELGFDSNAPALNNKIRIEVYVGINKLGILYRMLTLNTGQTPMSTRHQIEIIYSDYLNHPYNEEIRLIREVDDATPRGLGEYRFRDIIEGFTSFLERDYLTLERTDILENIKSLERLATVDMENTLFEDFLSTYHQFVAKMNELMAVWQAPTINMEGREIRPFGPNVISIFNKSQAMTGFGCAIGKLIDFSSIHAINDIGGIVDSLQMNEEMLNNLIYALDKVKSHAKKIGNDQRMYFFYLFKALFDSQSESCGNLQLAIESAYRSYERETF